ncbi:MAG: hypothetical protein E3J72_18185 [Planctomycetota bacterium]|nr:MAG: hypothetical protein E3J72_18185 [Planctomycetota bacterium]
MKFSLPLKLGVFVVLLFTIVIAGMLLYRPLMENWRRSKLRSATDHIRESFEDNFEKVSEGNYPGAKGWRTMFDGVSASVSNKKCSEGRQSFRLEGRANWFRCEYIPVSLGKIFAYKAKVCVENAGKGGGVGFVVKRGSSFGPTYNLVTFTNDERIVFRGERTLTEVGRYKAGTWYRVYVKIDFINRIADVYINGKLSGKNIPAAGIIVTDAGKKVKLEKFGLKTNNFSGSGTSVVYFDEVKLYY